MKEKIHDTLKQDDLCRIISETAKDMITVWDMDLTLIYANPSAEDTLGYNEKELKELLTNSEGPGLSRLVAPGSQDTFRTEVSTRLKGHSNLNVSERHHPVELELIRKDGSTIWTETENSPLRDGNGGCTGFFSITRNISERRHTRETLLKNEERHRNILESIEESYFELDLAGNFIFFNDALCRMTGYSQKELMGMNNRRYTTPETAQQLYEAFKEIHATGNPAKIDNYEVIQKNGEVRTNEMSASLMLDSSGSPTGFRGVARDVTEHKDRERELKESYGNLQRMLEGTIQTLAFTVEVRDPYTAGHQRRVAELAGAISQKMGLPLDEATGVRMAALIHDVGKVQIPGEILSKPGPLSANEMDLVKTHPAVGSSILKEIQFPWPISDIVLQHHGRLDGSGYPLGINGGVMSTAARIIAVADVVEAMVSHRPYRSALGLDKAIEEISNNKGTLYDTEVAEACLSLLTDEGFTFS
ncbi:MAG: PAS domain S-box protein [Syntrophales bacterium]|nr:PAS domain S-box protein [Syntrophales bacterium]